MEEQNPITPSETNEPPVIPPVMPTPTPPIQPEAPITTPPSEETPKLQKQILKWVLIALIVFLLGLSGFLTYQVLSLKNQIASRSTPTAQPSEIKSTPTSEASVSPTPTPTTSQPLNGDLANWKTYKNERYSFQIKYPEYMTLWPESTSSDSETLSSRPLRSSDKIFSVHISVRTVFLLSAVEGVSKKSAVKTSIGGVEAYKLDWVYTNRPVEPKELYTVVVLIPYKNLSYEISLYLDNQIKKERYLQIFDQILSTFQFID